MKQFPLTILCTAILSVIYAEEPNATSQELPANIVFEEQFPEVTSKVSEETSATFEISDEELEQELLSLEKELENENSEVLATETPAQAPETQVATEAVTPQEVIEPRPEVALITKSDNEIIDEEVQTIAVDNTQQPPSDSSQGGQTVASAEEEVADASFPSDEVAVNAEPETRVAEEKVIAHREVLQSTPAAIAEAPKGEKKSSKIEIKLSQVFNGSPIIYTVLLLMSITSFAIWLYTMLNLRETLDISTNFVKKVRNKLMSNQYEDALHICHHDHHGFFPKMISTGIQTRRHGLQMMLESMKAEGKRSTVSHWQRLNILNDIAVLAPLLGLLGTVLGMFYAFYDINRSAESVNTLFDGLGISVGTTVAGLVVAILAMMFHSTAKYRLVRQLTFAENEAQSIATLIDTQPIQ